MKRRNADCGKLRRPLKRNKITEGMYGSTLLYVKFLALWAMVILADFLLEFRFEFLWPFWLLLRSVYDSFKYQGLAFSAFFICIALTSDMICFFFVPVHWLFFAASTYVWVQYVWHTEKGFCLPTIILWLLFIYVEAAVRLRDLRHLPFHLDLCRPFAAHCIGYPVVTLGFGFKSYVGYRMRQRKQKDVAKENEFYNQLLQQALPIEQQQVAPQPVVAQTSQQVQSHAVPPHTCTDKSKLSSTSDTPNGLSNGSAHHNHHSHNHSHNNHHNHHHHHHTSSSSSSTTSSQSQAPASAKNNHRKSLDKGERERSAVAASAAAAAANAAAAAAAAAVASLPEQPEPSPAPSPTVKTSVQEKPPKYSQTNGSITGDIEYLEKTGSVNDFDENEAEKDKSFNKGSLKSNSAKWTSNQVRENAVNTQRERKNKANREPPTENSNTAPHKDEYSLKLETDVKRLMKDLQSSRQVEQELRLQLSGVVSGERNAKNELAQVQQDNDELQSKLHNLVTARQTDKQNAAQLERRLTEERRARSSVESLLAVERKAKKAEEANTARAIAMAATAAAAKSECTESCRARRRDLEAEVKHLRREIKVKEERCTACELEVQMLRPYKESHNEAEVLYSALSAMQEKNCHLEKSLSAETRFKLDLFSALGEVKRQLEIRDDMLRAREKEIEDLKTKFAQVVAVADTFSPAALDIVGHSMVGVGVSVCSTSKLLMTDHGNHCCTSNLDPNATAYTPKGNNNGSNGMTVITSTEA